MRKFALIGNRLSHSFSKSFFDKKFANKKNAYSYQNIEVNCISDLFESPSLEYLSGFNVTIPFKQDVIPFLDEVKADAQDIGAVNCVKKEGGKWVGYNTDYIGFTQSIRPFLKKHHKKALILGSGGAAKAIAFALKHLLKIEFLIISRDSKANYECLSQSIIEEHPLIINCTPLGTFPMEEKFPAIPYQWLKNKHLLYDLVYNPPLSMFLKKGKQYGCQTINGLDMLYLQAEKSWEIWSD